MFSGWSRIKEADTDKPFTEIKGTEFDPVGTAAGDHHLIGSGEGETEAFHIHFAFFDLEKNLRRTGRRIDPAVADGFSQILFHKHGGFQTSLIFIRHQFNDHFSVFDDRKGLTTCRIHCKKQGTQNGNRKYFTNHYSLTSILGFLISTTGICSPGLIPSVPEITTTWKYFMPLSIILNFISLRTLLPLTSPAKRNLPP